ncbi:exosortase family protein XrtF [Urechidicola croceus]|uniref:Exosortase family protein XrtF n=1 Tax=Urechidicola croceus TaxID=1850246 RepID=A0A1D8PAR0_9FLAO|nr:exosortase family protein XrtF [Urechidicola croceus]AOW21660.1 exosortase family protein XrtF [Urechidicola croceus]
MKKNKVVILFLVKFFLVYFSLTFLYTLYLERTQDTGAIFSCAPITKVVTQHSENVAELFGYDIYTEQNFDELSMKFLVNGSYVARIVEGCSSISIMILFLAFIIAFSGSFKATIIYGLMGVVLIYITNILRIVILAIGIYHYPKYQDVLHSLVFPALIYGMVFLLWVIWVRKYATINKKAE